MTSAFIHTTYTPLQCKIDDYTDNRQLHTRITSIVLPRFMCNIALSLTTSAANRNVETGLGYKQL